MCFCMNTYMYRHGEVRGHIRYLPLLVSTLFAVLAVVFKQGIPLYLELTGLTILAGQGACEIYLSAHYPRAGPNRQNHYMPNFFPCRY